MENTNLNTEGESVEMGGVSPTPSPSVTAQINNDAFRTERDALIEGAGRVYESLIKSWEFQVTQLSKKGLLRVLLALVKVPLKDFERQLDAKEKNVYLLSERLLQSKFLLENLVVQEELETIQKKEEENVSVSEVQ